MSNFTRGDRAQIAVLLLCLIPFVATIFLGVESGNATIVVLSTGLAIASAGFSLAWGTESLQFLVSQALALGVLALVNVLPEYSVEVVLAYKGAADPTFLHYATATMTGANRILLGLGWPVVFLLSAYAGRSTAPRLKDLVLDEMQSVEIFFLGLATLYSFVIALKGSLGPFDAAVLLTIFVAYVSIASRLPARPMEHVAELEGPSRAVASMKGNARAAFIALFVAIGAVAILFGSQPFVTNFIALSSQLNLGAGGEYLLIQWLTPVLTELPEAVTVFYWAAKTGKGSLALASLVSSKLNQWTILVATIPVVYSVALGGLYSIQLTDLQTHEILLTGAQSLYGSVCLLDLRMSKWDVAILLSLFTFQLVVPAARLEVSVAYIALAAVELLRVRRADVVANVIRSVRAQLH